MTADPLFPQSPDPVKAMRMAEIAHAGQQYSDGVAYVSHLRAVTQVLERYGLTNPVIIAAAWLHDAIEDTTVSYNDIKKSQGVDVAELVYAVTSELGRNRKERNAKTYPKLREAGELAIVLKLADRIANIEAGLSSGEGKTDMYAAEFGEFASWLYDPRHIRAGPMWRHLRRLLLVSDGS